MSSSQRTDSAYFGDMAPDFQPLAPKEESGGQKLADLRTLGLNTEPALLFLPTELQMSVISHLTFPATQFLRSTCRHFSTLIPALSSVGELLEAENSDSANTANAFACAVCLRIRGPGKFSDDFRRGLFGKRRERQDRRFCIDCGVRPPEGADTKLRYRWGDTWTRFGVPYVKCRGCLSKKRGVRERKESPMCPGCWDRKKGRGR